MLCLSSDDMSAVTSRDGYMAVALAHKRIAKHKAKMDGLNKPPDETPSDIKFEKPKKKKKKRRWKKMEFYKGTVS